MARGIRYSAKLVSLCFQYSIKFGGIFSHGEEKLEFVSFVAFDLWRHYRTTVCLYTGRVGA